MSNTPAPRLRSIDVLRGADMFFLSGGASLLLLTAAALNGGVAPEWLAAQLRHADWGTGFTCWDLVMPLFLFICGASMPFSFAKYRREGAGWRTALRVARRVLLLFVLGMVVQGNLLGLAGAHRSLFCNTLQAIAEGYLITAVVLSCCRVRGMLLSCAGLLLGYWFLLKPVPYAGQAAGLFLPEANIAHAIDCALQGSWQDGTPYTWIATAPAFGAITLMGALGGCALQRLRGWRALLLLSLGGLGCAAAGWLLRGDTPIIKHLFTSTMVLWAGGWCLLLLALCHALFDLLPQLHRAAYPLIVIGSNALLAYVLSNFYLPTGQSLWEGVLAFLPLPEQALPAALIRYALFWLLLWLLYRRRLFLRV